MRKLYIRIILNVLIAFSILWLPWWISLLSVFVLMALFRAYEVFVWAFIYDSLYGGALPAVYGFDYLATAGIVVLFVIIESVKTRMLYY